MKWILNKLVLRNEWQIMYWAVIHELKINLFLIQKMPDRTKPISTHWFQFWAIIKLQHVTLTNSDFDVNKLLASHSGSPSSRITEINSILTKSSNMSLWWTWIVMRVSYLVLSASSRSLVVMSIRVLSISRKYWLVLAIIRRSCRALDRASSESRVHMIWMPNNPTLKNKKKLHLFVHFIFIMLFRINSHINVMNNWVLLTLMYLSRERIEKVDKLKLRFLCGRGSLSNYRMKWTLWFF